MDTQDDDKKNEDINPVEDTNDEPKIAEEESENTEEVEKEEEVEDLSGEEAWQEKFKKQSSNAQRTITKANERLYSVNLKLAEKDQNHILELAEGDDKDVKMARQIAKEVFDSTLEQVLEEVRSDDETKEEMEKRIYSEVERKAERKAIYKMFVKTNSKLNDKSTDFNTELRNDFDVNFERLMGNDIVTIEETSELLEDAYYLATRGKSDSIRVQEEIATAGSGGGSMGNIVPSSNQAVKELDEELSKYGIAPLSKEAKKLVAQGKL